MLVHCINIEIAELNFVLYRKFSRFTIVITPISVKFDAKVRLSQKSIELKLFVGKRYLQKAASFRDDIFGNVGYLHHLNH